MVASLAYQTISFSGPSIQHVHLERRQPPLKAHWNMKAGEISKQMDRRLVSMQILLSVLGLSQTAKAEIVTDKYGRTIQKICPWAYFPCYQDGVFCFRPIYCEGQFSPEGSLNAAIIFTGILAPAYTIWRRKAGLDPDPNTPEGKEFYLKRYGIQKRSTPAEPRPLSRFFGKPKQPQANIQNAEGDSGQPIESSESKTESS